MKTQPLTSCSWVRGVWYARCINPYVTAARMRWITITRGLEWALGRAYARYWVAMRWRSRKDAFLLAVFFCAIPSALAWDVDGTTGSVEGTVLAGDPGHQSFVAGARVV